MGFGRINSTPSFAGTGIKVMVIAITLASPLHAEPVPDIGLLGSEKYASRQQAYNRLLQWTQSKPVARLDQIATLYHRETHPEIKARLHAILKTVYLNRAKPHLGLTFKEESLTLKNGCRVKAMRVVRVTPDKASHKGGIKKGDKIVAMGQSLPKNRDKVHETKSQIPLLTVGEKVPFHILRDDKHLILMIRIEGQPKGTEEEELKRLNQFKKWLASKKTSL